MNLAIKLSHRLLHINQEDDDDLSLSQESTKIEKKKSSKKKDKSKKSKGRNKKSKHIVTEEGSSCEESLNLSVLEKEMKKEKKKRTKKFEHSSESLGCVIIPDCEDCDCDTILLDASFHTWTDCTKENTVKKTKKKSKQLKKEKKTKSKSKTKDRSTKSLWKILNEWVLLVSGEDRQQNFANCVAGKRAEAKCYRFTITNMRTAHI